MLTEGVLSQIVLVYYTLLYALDKTLYLWLDLLVNQKMILNIYKIKSIIENILNEKKRTARNWLVYFWFAGPSGF